jgi:hypothetical protein
MAYKMILLKEEYNSMSRVIKDPESIDIKEVISKYPPINLHFP